MFPNLLKKQDFIKLQLFHYIATHNQVEIHHLTAKFALSKTSIRRNIDDLNRLLESDNATSHLQINQTESFHYYLTLVTQEELAFVLLKVQTIYLKNSTRFQLLELFFEFSHLTIYTICTTLYISENYCYKILNQVKSILKPFSISIKKNNQTQTFSLNGLEINIRCLYLLLYIPSFQRIDYPFNHISLDQLKQSYSKEMNFFMDKKAPSTQTRIEFLITIIKKRLDQNLFVENPTDPLGSIIDVFIQQKDATEHIILVPKTSFHIPDAYIEQERKHFNFLIRILDSNTDTNEDKLQIGKDLTLLQNPISTFYTSFIPTFMEKYYLKQNSKIFYLFIYYAVFYHSHSLHSSINHLSLDPINKKSNPITINKKFQYKIIAELKEAFATYQIPTHLISNFTIDSISLLLVTLVQIYKEKELLIFVQYSKDLVGEHFIKNIIQQFYNEKAIRFVSSIHDADILISDCIEFQDTDAEFYLFEDTSRFSSWVNLSSFLQERLYKIFIENHY